MDQQNPTLAKILILDTGKFKQWQFRIQQYLQHEHYALWEVIEFRDSYVAPTTDAATGSASEETATKKGRTVALTTEDMQKRKNDVKARTTLLLALPDEHQLRFSKYKTAQELWAAILKTFGGNEATKKTKKNLLKQQYGNFKSEGSETLEQNFNRLHAIVSHLEFMDIEIKQDDLNQKFLTKVQKKSESNSHNMAFISSAKHSSGKEEVNTVSIPTASTNVSPASANIRGPVSVKTLLVLTLLLNPMILEEDWEEDNHPRPSPSVESNPNDLQNSSSFASENGESTGKFKEKGDEGYFIGYSMSSKAFRAFNKRTRKVEENLHVELLENKAIEKGAGPNWLFDIDSLTKSMNYVPVDAGTISTNLSDTKDATS
nr:ribonuclease H-like domain-containing protein [Tanacetum cinerariifolium]